MNELKRPFFYRFIRRVYYILFNNYRLVTRKFMTILINILFFFSKIFGLDFFIHTIFNSKYENFFMIPKPLNSFNLKKVKNLLKCKLIHFDVGSRGGLLPVVENNRDLFDIILCEPEEIEASSLRKSGYTVIEKVICNKIGKIELYYCQKMPSASSIYKPQGPFLDFYNGSKNYYSRWETTSTSFIESTTLSKALQEKKISNLDFLKIDVQGAELDVLKGLGKYKPIIIISELQYLPMYDNVPNGYSICAYLFDLGYIPFQLTAKNHSESVCPIWGDGYFMPSWKHPKGKDIILSNEEKYIALMLLHNQNEILHFVNKKLKLRNKVFIDTILRSKFKNNIMKILSGK